MAAPKTSVAPAGSASRVARTQLEIPEDPFAPLVSYFRLSTSRFHLASVAYERLSQRSRLIGRLRSALPDWRLVELSLQDPRIELREHTGYFFELLRQIVEANAGGEKVDAVLLLDWEQRLAATAPDDEPVTFLGMFNVGRHLLAEKFSCPFAVLMPYDEMAQLKRQAPDFASWMSGTFSFPFGQKEIEAGLRAALEVGEPTDRRDAVASAQRLESCLEDWTAAVGAGDGLGELWPRALERLGELYLDRLGDARRGADYFARLASWAASRGPEAEGWRQRARTGKRRAARPAAPKAEPRADPWQIFRGAATLEDEIFGRELDLERLLEKILGPVFRCGVLWGETGCGKSSLVRAGLAKSLTRIGYLPVVVDRYEGLEATLCQAVAEAGGLAEAATTLAATIAAVDAELRLKASRRQVVLLCDQFERVFSPPSSESRRERRPFFGSLVAAIEETRLPFCCVLSVRADRLYHLHELDRMLPVHRPLSPANTYELRWLRAADAGRVFDQLGAASGAAWAPELVGRVVEDLTRDARVRPVEIQLVAAALFLRSIETVAAYEEAGGCEGLFQDYLDAVLDDLPEPMAGRRALRALVLSESPPLRAVRTAAETAEVAHGKERAIAKALEELATRHVVQAVDGEGPRRWELVHDVLCEPAWKAASPQGIGASVLRRAVRERRWWLKLRESWWALRSDTEELPEAQRTAARRLLRRTVAVLGAKVLLAMLLLLAAVQLSMAHVHIETEDPQAVRVYHGLRAFDFLPAPLGHSPWFDTGLTDDDVPANQRNQLFELRLLRWDGAQSSRTERFQSHLDALAGARSLAYLGVWDYAVRILLEGFDDPVFIPLNGTARSKLAEMGMLEPDKVVELVLPYVEDPSPEIRSAAAEALGMIGQDQAETAVSEILPLLNDRESAVRISAAAALGRFGGEQAGRVVEGLLPLLGDMAPKIPYTTTVHYAVVQALGQIGGEKVEAEVERLLPLLDHPESDFRWTVAKMLGKIGGEQPETVVERLLPLLNDSDFDVRGAAIGALEQIGKEHAAVVVEKLVPLLSDQSPDARRTAARLVGEIGREQATEKLLPLLNDPDLEVRRVAIEALGQIQGEPAEAVEKLLALLEDTEPYVRGAAAGALTLGQIRREQAEVAVERLLPLLDDREESSVRGAASRALGYIGGQQAQTVVARLLPLLNDLDSWVRGATAGALGQIGGEQADVIVDKVLPLLADPVDSVRGAAARALGKIGGQQADRVVEKLVDLLEESRSLDSNGAEEALWQIGKERPDLVAEKLLPIFNDRDSPVRRRAAEILTEVARTQTFARSTLPRIAVYRTDPDGIFRRSIHRTLVLHEYYAAQNETASVHKHFLAELRSRNSRLDARYREAVVHVLARWYNAGLGTEGTGEPVDPKALAEHETFQKELDRLRNLERPWRLRIAACDVLVEAFRLRQ